MYSSRALTDITFYDGLGYPEQVVNVAASANQENNVVAPIYYDKMRRDDARVYLPYITNYSELWRDARPFASQEKYYLKTFNDEHKYTYQENVYENSSLNRVLHTYNVGQAFRELGNEKKTAFNHHPNSNAEVYKLVTNILTGQLSIEGYYNKNTLSKTVVEDEDGSMVITFVDSQGRNVLKRLVTLEDNTVEYFDTYYVYDDFDRLSWVISPEGSRLLTQSGQLNPEDDIAKKYCYVYNYDGRGRMTERRLPGKAWEYMVYDNGDRLVLSQDGNMRDKDQWQYNIYDNLSRIAEQTIVRGNLTKEQIQGRYDAAGFDNSYPIIGGATNKRVPFSDNSFSLVSSISSARYGGYGYVKLQDDDPYDPQGAWIPVFATQFIYYDHLYAREILLRYKNVYTN